MRMSKLNTAVAGLLVIGALGIGVSALAREALAADSVPLASKSALSRQDENLKEKVLALEKRIWEAHARQDVKAFRNLLAEDFCGTDVHGASYTKADVLDYVANFRVVEPVMENARVILLNDTSAVVTYEIRYQVASRDGKALHKVAPRRATTVWAL